MFHRSQPLGVAQNTWGSDATLARSWCSAVPVIPKCFGPAEALNDAMIGFRTRKPPQNQRPARAGTPGLGGGEGARYPSILPHHGTERSLPISHDGGCGCGCGCGCGYGVGRGPTTPGISTARTTAGSRGRHGPSLGTPRDIAPAGSRAKSHDSRRQSSRHVGGPPTAQMALTPVPDAVRAGGRTTPRLPDALGTKRRDPTVGTSRLPGPRPSLPDSTRIAQTPPTIRPPN
jgi:hypothetical protein